MKSFSSSVNLRSSWRKYPLLRSLPSERLWMSLPPYSSVRQRGSWAHTRQTSDRSRIGQNSLMPPRKIALARATPKTIPVFGRARHATVSSVRLATRSPPLVLTTRISFTLSLAQPSRLPAQCLAQRQSVIRTKYATSLAKLSSSRLPAEK